VNLALDADLLEGDEFADRFQVFLSGRGFIEELAEFRGLRRGVRAHVIDEGNVSQRVELAAGPHQYGEGEDDLPEVAFEHGSIGLKGGGFCGAKTSGRAVSRDYIFSAGFSAAAD